MTFLGHQEMQVITPEQAKDVLGDHALIIEGMNMILYDTNQFMAVSRLSFSQIPRLTDHR